MPAKNASPHPQGNYGVLAKPRGKQSIDGDQKKEVTYSENRLGNQKGGNKCLPTWKPNMQNKMKKQVSLVTVRQSNTATSNATLEQSANCHQCAGF